jgi:hypothetical protein
MNDRPAGFRAMLIVALVILFGKGVNAACMYDSCQACPLFTCSLDYCTTMTALNLASHGLYGTIPSSLTHLTNLASLNLANNSLSGEIPTGIGSMAALHVLRLDGNFFTGPVPVSIGSLHLATDISLFGNELTGSIPAGLGELPDLQSLDLSQNRLGGAIPDSFCQLQSKGASVAFNNVWCDQEYDINYENIMKGDLYVTGSLLKRCNKRVLC